MPVSKSKEQKRKVRQQRRDQRRKARKERQARRQELQQADTQSLAQDPKTSPDIKVHKSKTRMWDTQTDSFQSSTPVGTQRRSSDGNTRKVKPGTYFGGGRA